jgi:hypothetical protein
VRSYYHLLRHAQHQRACSITCRIMHLG